MTLYLLPYPLLNQKMTYFDTSAFENLSSSFTRDSKVGIHSTSKLFKIYFDAEVFEKYVLAEASNLQHYYSESFHSSTISNCSDYSCCNELDEIIRNASKVLDKK